MSAILGLGGLSILSQFSLEESLLRGIYNTSIAARTPIANNIKVLTVNYPRKPLALCGTQHH
jgi:hypothetical protein